MVVLTAYTLPFQSDIGVDSIHFGIEVPASSMDVPVPPSGGFPISIAGRNYIVDTSFEPYRREAFKHKSIPAQRQSLHYTNSPDDGTISTEGLWRREARDWSLGAGQTYFDRKKSDDARFYRSKGINPWNQWEVSLLQDTKQQHSGTGTIKAIRVGNYSDFREANAIKVLLIGLMALLSVIVFTIRGEIDWLWAIPLSAGGIIGSLIGTRFSLGPNAAKWVFWMLVFILGIEAVKLSCRFL